jgi:hypothetical protein
VAFNLSPPPSQEPDKDTYVWVNWFNQLYTYLTLVGRLAWTVIDFTGSNITDIASRAHNDLTGQQGGSTTERYHMTAAQHTAIGVAPVVTVVDAAADTTTFVGLWPSATGDLAAITDAGISYNASTNILTVTGGVSAPVDGTVGATTPAAGTFTTLSSTGIGAIGTTTSATTALNLPLGTAGVSSLRVAHGEAPTSPVDGDIWTTTAGLYVRINGATVGPLT